MLRLKRVIAAVALVAFTAPAAAALDFQTRQIGGRSILILRDQFRLGDAAVLRRDWLEKNRFDEIWMISPGGNLWEGVLVGRALREYGATVRVPGNAVCASSCTVAFMGGLFRYLDEDATFHVHAASSVKGGIPSPISKSYEEGGFEQVARKMRIDARFNAFRLLRHFQNTLLQSRRVALPEDDEFERWSQSPNLRSQAAKDQDRYENEGIASLQDILMRIERDAMSWAIQDLRAAVDDLGPRAADAIAMIEAMYTAWESSTARSSPGKRCTKWAT